MPARKSRKRANRKQHARTRRLIRTRGASEEEIPTPCTAVPATPTLCFDAAASKDISPMYDTKQLVSQLFGDSTWVHRYGEPVAGQHGSITFNGAHVSSKAWDRMRVCMLIGEGMHPKAACEWVGGVSFNAFRRTEWYPRFVENPFSVLKNVEHTRKRNFDEATELLCMGRLNESGRTKKKLRAAGYQQLIAEHRDSIGDTRPVPSFTDQ